MAYSRSELKMAAKEQIKGNVWTYFGLSIVIGLILSAASFTFVGTLVLAGPLELGLTMFMMQVVREGKGKFNTGFNGFDRFGSSLVATLLSTLYILLWSMLFVIPGIIATFRYALIYYIIADDPEISGSAAIKKSKEMMKGHKWEFFVLGLSFIGWALLVVVTFGIAAIYVEPYIQATYVNFYEKLKAEQAPKVEA